MKFFSVIVLLLLSTNSVLSQPKLSPFSQKLISSLKGEHILDQSLKERVFLQNDELRALIKVMPNTEPKNLERMGVSVNTMAGDVWSITFPVDALNRLKNDKQILQVEIAEKIKASKPNIDKSRKALSVDQVHKGLEGVPRAYTGKGVIVGIIDVGFQASHPTFYSADGKTNRIMAYWNQNSPEKQGPSGLGYGKLVTTTSEIEKEWKNGYFHSHGTWVASIAGGSGLGSNNFEYKGIAPESMLAFVELKHTSEEHPYGSSKNDLIVSNPSILDAISYLFSLSEVHNKPVVANLSWSMHTGPHDGTSLFDLAIDNLVGPRKILVGSAANDGETSIHLKTKIRNGDTARTIPVLVNRDFAQNRKWPESNMVDIWGSQGSTFKLGVSVLNRAGDVLLKGPFISSARNNLVDTVLVHENDTFTLSFFCQKAYAGNSKPNIRIEMLNPASHKYHVSLNLVSESDSCELHAWHEGAVWGTLEGAFINDLIRLDESYLKGDNHYTVGENCGTANKIITVGSYNIRKKYTNQLNSTVKLEEEELAISNFSSYGPTADGRVKPNVIAPGGAVAMAHSKAWYHPYAANILYMNVENDTAAWSVNSGTSFSAPMVTGIVALMLEADPWLTPERTLSILQETAESDNFTGKTPNMRAGYGKVNALKAVTTARLTNTPFPQSGAGLKMALFPNPAATYLNFETEIENPKWTVFDMNGRELLNGTGSEVIVEQLKPAQYLLAVYNDKKIATTYFQITD